MKAWNRICELLSQQTSVQPLLDNVSNALQDQADALGSYFESLLNRRIVLWIVSSSRISELQAQERKPRTSPKTRRKLSSNKPHNRFYCTAELKPCLNTLWKQQLSQVTSTIEWLGTYTQDRKLQGCATTERLKEAIVVPILKEGKDPGAASSYTPTALTRCVCKVFEKMISRR